MNVLVQWDGIGAEKSQTSNGDSAALGLTADGSADAAKGLAFAGSLRGSDAIDISDTKNIGITAQRVAVQKSRGAPGFGATGESRGSLSGGSSESCGEEKSGNGEELHLD